MPLPLTQALDDQSGLAAAKAALARRSLARYVLSATLAGAFLGVAVVLMLMVSAPMLAAGSGNVRLVQGAVFGVALALVVFAGAELFTDNTMVMLQGLWTRTTSLVDLAIVWVASLVGNLVGALGFAVLVNASGVATATGGAAPGQQTVYAAALAGLERTKASLTGGQLFFRAVLCNFLVCLAVWMAARATSDAAKLLCLWWGLLAFVASGFEHAVANMALLPLAALSGDTGWGEVSRNLLYTVPGNVVGGALLVGAAYAWLAAPGTAPAKAAAPSVERTDTPVSGPVEPLSVPRRRTTPPPTTLPGSRPDAVDLTRPLPTATTENGDR